MITIWFDGGPHDAKSLDVDCEIADLPRYFTHAAHVGEHDAFRPGYVYEKLIDNASVDLGDGPQAQYRYRGVSGVVD